jgi:hypothetical protein
MTREFDLRDAINAVSDVVANRAPPLREFDQIYIKMADMVIQAHYIAERFHEQDVVFIGDGDAIALTVMHLGRQEIFPKSPRRVHVLDFDERIVKSIIRFAEKYDFAERVGASLYNVVDALPKEYLRVAGGNGMAAAKSRWWDHYYVRYFVGSVFAVPMMLAPSRTAPMQAVVGTIDQSKVLDATVLGKDDDQSL